ncbi:site-specific integrase [Pusillimonas sp. SM2304]|uniref:tyrosine-type recombinase/integrase n=1 Tax=Pusillimonas sp. SM2304 TaxID=3073241 RepID=UPI002876938C|nr:site-specific integrase [Pusillimonas sp. SM2304]MDS1141709.1 site-specific integrase [Pusillimonas sp. SM2304]
MNNKRERRLRKSAPTLRSALALYVVEIASQKNSIKQAKSLERIWNSTRLASRTIASIKNLDLHQIMDEWLETLAPSTVCRRVAMISHMYTIARKKWGFDWIPNPVELVQLPAVDDARDRRLFDHMRLRGVSEDECPRNELDWIINATRSAQLPTILWLAVETAMRRAEITRIERQHIDLTRDTIYIPITKNREPRIVPLSPWAKYVLRLYLHGRPRRGPIFTLDPDGVTKAFIRARTKAKENYHALCAKYGRRPQPAYFDDLRFHDMRHEATSRLANVYQIHQLAKITGHKDPKMLLRYYHPDGYDLSRILAKSELGRRQLDYIRTITQQEDRLAA